MISESQSYNPDVLSCLANFLAMKFLPHLS